MHCSDYKIVQERRTSIEPQQQTHRLPPKNQQITLRGFFLKVSAKANGVQYASALGVESSNL